MKKSFLSFVLSLLTASLFGQWTSDTDLNTLVAASKTGDIQAISTSDGKTYVAFWHDVPAPQYYEMRLQLLDENGYAQFGTDGMLVNGDVAMSSYTTIWWVNIDEADNLYIGFNGTGGNAPAYVHKIAPDGTQLWGASGVQVGSGFAVKVLPLSDGGALIGWTEDSQATIRKYDAGGNPVWPAPVAIQPGVTGADTYIGEWAEMSNGDVVLIYHNLSFVGLYGLPFAQRYDSDGNAAWPSPLALTSGVYVSFYRRYPLVQDGDVLYFGYTGSVGLDFFSYLLRINPDGTLPWGPNGSDFSTQSTDYEINTEVAGSEGSAYIWGLCQYTDQTQGKSGEYIQKFDRETGARQFTDLAKVVFPITDDYIYHQGYLQLVDDQPFFVISDGYSSGVEPVDLLAVYLDENGDFAWPEQTRPVATNDSGGKGRVQWLRPHSGRSVCVWTETRPEAGESRAYAQRVEAVPSTGLAEIAGGLKWEVFPNPTNGAIAIRVDLPEAGAVSFSLFTVLGERLVEQTVEWPEGRSEWTYLAGLPVGMYWVRIQAGGQYFVLPVSVIR